jgi:predicted nucleic acid-binding Zn ribbon protein
MPIYEYETIPTRSGDKVRRMELRQSMTEPVLTRHPETGEAIRKVYTAFHVGGVSTSNYASAPQTSGHGSGCACCRPDGMCGLDG